MAMGKGLPATVFFFLIIPEKYYLLFAKRQEFIAELLTIVTGKRPQ